MPVRLDARAPMPARGVAWQVATIPGSRQECGSQSAFPARSHCDMKMRRGVIVVKHLDFRPVDYGYRRHRVALCSHPKVLFRYRSADHPYHFVELGVHAFCGFSLLSRCARKSTPAPHDSLRNMRRGPPRRCNAKHSASPALWSDNHPPYRDARRPPASPVNTLAPNLSHQRYAIPIRARAERQGLNDSLVLIEDVGNDRNDAVDFLPAILEFREKHRNVVIGFVVCIPRAWDPNSTTRSIRSPYSSSSAARKRFRIGSSAGPTDIGHSPFTVRITSSGG